ncbi:hypothetical protein LSH36_561g01032 [Paralvinella palmiformis]|uniref:Uncharacterized protein n=1 Tax=Paralvinella palmiformis TaxID=53620 RepID=A0AAD9J6I4_9ANNE|nr:hypothetical protein LSH36_561g01032 [Paralvinella palmiformis]
MLSLFDPTLEPDPEPPGDLLKLIPMYHSPKILSAVLPALHLPYKALLPPYNILQLQYNALQLPHEAL